jgi:hypothetical protein
MCDAQGAMKVGKATRTRRAEHAATRSTADTDMRAQNGLRSRGAGPLAAYYNRGCDANRLVENFVWLCLHRFDLITLNRLRGAALLALSLLVFGSDPLHIRWALWSVVRRSLVLDFAEWLDEVALLRGSQRRDALTASGPIRCY